jgi:hypothetical protein
MVAFFTAVATFLVMLLLVWLAERRRINWVRWLSAALFVLGGPSVFANLKRSMSARLKSGLGQKRRSRPVRPMSAYPPDSGEIADVPKPPLGANKRKSSRLTARPCFFVWTGLKYR